MISTICTAVHCNTSIAISWQEDVLHIGMLTNITTHGSVSNNFWAQHLSIFIIRLYWGSRWGKELVGIRCINNWHVDQWFSLWHCFCGPSNYVLCLSGGGERKKRNGGVKRLAVNQEQVALWRGHWFLTVSQVISIELTHTTYRYCLDLFFYVAFD